MKAITKDELAKAIEIMVGTEAKSLIKMTKADLHKMVDALIAASERSNLAAK